MQKFGGNMQYVIAVFRSRNETLYLANLLMSKGYKVDIISTPREVGQACGISVKFSHTLLTIARGIIASKPFRSFYGFYKIAQNGGRTSIIRL